MDCQPISIRPGSSTAYPFNVRYRLSRVRQYIAGGDWLDYGCAEGGYTEALIRAGADTACGFDIAKDRIQAARQAYPGLSFYDAQDGTLPFRACSFDGVFMNEVFEHVEDEARVLNEINRVLKPGGLLILIAPNRCFPFEGHMVTIRNRGFMPSPIVPWLPKRLTYRWTSARNYWPRELRVKIAASGMRIIETGYILPVLEAYRWLPESMAKLYRKNISSIEALPGVRKFCSVSTLVVAQCSALYGQQ